MCRTPWANSIPSAWRERFPTLISRVRNSDQVIWSTHRHNDLGMAVANSLAAVQGGAPSGGMHHQRPGRTRRQCLAGRSGDGGQNPP